MNGPHFVGESKGWRWIPLTEVILMWRHFQHIEAETNGRHFPDDMFKCIFLNENVFISIKISLKFVPKGSINNIPSLVQVMAWRRPGDKPLSEPMLVSLLTHICVTRPHTPAQGLDSLSGKASYSQIQWNLEAARLDAIMIISFYNLTGISAALIIRWRALINYPIY